MDPHHVPGGFRTEELLPEQVAEDIAFTENTVTLTGRIQVLPNSVDPTGGLRLTRSGFPYRHFVLIVSSRTKRGKYVTYTSVPCVIYGRAAEELINLPWHHWVHVTGKLKGWRVNLAGNAARPMDKVNWECWEVRVVVDRIFPVGSIAPGAYSAQHAGGERVAIDVGGGQGEFDDEAELDAGPSEGPASK